MTDRRTPDATLIEAVRILSRTIHTDDGVIPACLNEVATRLAELVEDRRWVPVGEKLPPTDAEVLLTCEIDGDFTDVCIGKSTGRMNEYGSAVIMDLDGDDDWVPCTHWQRKPLPPGPERDG